MQSTNSEYGSPYLAVCHITYIFLLLLINFTPELKFYTIHYNSTIFYTISSNYITKYHYNAFNILTITIIVIIIHYIYNTQLISLVY